MSNSRRHSCARGIVNAVGEIVTPALAGEKNGKTR